MALPANVLAALEKGRKLEAVKLLRSARGIGLMEAKDIIEKYQKNSGRHQPAQSSDILISDNAELGELPPAVTEALHQGKKIEAIKLLRQTRGLDLKSAKAVVELSIALIKEGGKPVDQREQSNKNFTLQNIRKFLMPALVLGAIVWAMVNSIDMIAGVIVLIQHKGYRKQIFTVERLTYSDDPESGLFWGFEGNILGDKERFYAPTLADGKALRANGLKKKFPPDTQFEVWFNDHVTKTLFQGRTIRVLPYSPDLVASEARHISWWLSYCLLPLVVIMGIAVIFERQRAMQ